MVIQSAGTGLACGIFLLVFAAPGDAAGAGVAVEVVTTGFCAQPPVSSATALKSNKILFIDPPEIFLRVGNQFRRGVKQLPGLRG
jgi:hypothetical protein